MIDRVAARDLIASACFFGFVLAVWLVYRSRTPEYRRLAITRLAVYTLFISFAVGLTERNLFPFTSWDLIAWLYPDRVSYQTLVAEDTHGIEHHVDYRAWQPLSVDELASWIARGFDRLDRPGKDSALAYLLERANHAVTLARHRQRIGDYDRILGPFAAPLFHLHPAPWSDSTRVPPDRLTALRIYREWWTPEERSRDSTRVDRELVFEYRDVR